MHGTDLPAHVVARLHHAIDRQRDYQQRLLDRLEAVGVPASDPLYQHVRAALLSLRQLAVSLTDGLPKGQARRYLRRAQTWRRV